MTDHRSAIAFAHRVIDAGKREDAVNLARAYLESRTELAVVKRERDDYGKASRHYSKALGSAVRELKIKNAARRAALLANLDAAIEEVTES